MKVIFFNHFISGGGAERVTSLLSKQFVEDGYEVKLVTDIYYPFAYNFDERVDVLPLFKKDGQRDSKLSILWMIKNCRKHIKREKADILIGILPWMTFTLYLASLGLKTKIIASDHTSVDRPVRWHISLIKKYIYPRVSAVTLLTETDAKIIGDKLLNKHVMPNPLTFPVISDYNNQRRTNILAVGRLDVWKVKGFDLLIKAWAKICNRYPEWKLEVAGTGSDEAIKQIIQMADENGITKQFKLLGFRKDIDCIMRESSVFALTSRIEGFGMVLIEAMSQGCACVSFDNGGRQREIITKETEGFVIENYDIDEFAQKLSVLISYPQIRRDIAIEGSKRASAYNLPIIAKRWEELFNMLKKK